MAGEADPPQQKGAWDGTLIHGNASALPLWLLLHWANTPNCSFPAGPFSPPAHCLCPRISFRLGGGGKIALRATEQTVEKGACHLYPVPRRTCLFLFFYLSSKLSSWAESLMSESWINCFKPKGPATHHQTLPEMFYWRLLKLSHYTRCTNTGRQEEPSSVFNLLFMVLNHSEVRLWMFSLRSFNSF